MKLIEIIGIPGSGKSTGFNELFEKFVDSEKKVYKEQDIKNMYLQKKYKFLIFFGQNNFLINKMSKKIFKLLRIKNDILLEFIKSHQSFISIILSINSQRFVSDREQKHVLELLFETIFIYELAKKVLNDNDYLILDEGYLHKLMTIFVSKDIGISEDELKQVLFFYGEPEYLICYETNIQTSFKRLKNRKRGFPNRMRKLSDEDKYIYLKNMEYMYTKIVNICLSHENIIFDKNIT